MLRPTYIECGASAQSRGERRANWDMASGLQGVDGLRVSGPVADMGERYVDGEYDARELLARVSGYHDDADDDESREADVVAARINALLAESRHVRFRLIPHTLASIHARLFEGILPDRRWVGSFRTVDISKPEPVLGGRSVEYAPWREVAAYLDYDFAEEASFPYAPPFDAAQVDHLARFVSRVWETHPFREGNTRTCAVFSQIYLRQLGLPVDNEPFRERGRWYRDALVRASYASVAEGIHEDRSFLDAFYENVLLGAGHDLDSMDMNVHGIRVDDVPYREVPERESLGGVIGQPVAASAARSWERGGSSRGWDGTAR